MRRRYHAGLSPVPSLTQTDENCRAIRAKQESSIHAKPAIRKKWLVVAKIAKAVVGVAR